MLAKNLIFLAQDTTEINKELQEYREALASKEEEITRLDLQLKELSDLAEDVKKNSQSSARSVVDKLVNAQRENQQLKNEVRDSCLYFINKTAGKTVWRDTKSAANNKGISYTYYSTCYSYFPCSNVCGIETKKFCSNLFWTLFSCKRHTSFPVI